MSITARTDKVKTCIYFPRVSSDNSRLHRGVLQVVKKGKQFLLLKKGHAVTLKILFLGGIS